MVLCHLKYVQYAPYKTGSKSTLAERARKLGLESVAKTALENPWKFNIKNSIKLSVKGKVLLL